jgi:hypothetical protein
MSKLKSFDTLPPIGEDVLVKSRGEWRVLHLAISDYWIANGENGAGKSISWYPGGLPLSGADGWTWLPNTPKKEKLVWRPHFCTVPYTTVSGTEHRAYAVECLHCKRRNLPYKVDPKELFYE